MFSSLILQLWLAFGAPADTACSGPLTREAVIECAVAASPRLRADHESVTAAREEVDAARVLLPSNPNVAVTVAERWNDAGDRYLNVSGTISQRIEIAGERRKRKAVAQAEVGVREHAAAVTERDVIAQALVAYYDALAAREELEVAERGHATAVRLQEVAQARATDGLGSALEVELVSAQSMRLEGRVALARGRSEIARARLASALGLDPEGPLPEVKGELDPLPTSERTRPAGDAATARPELAMEVARQRAHEARVDQLRRERAPTPTLSVFAQTDGFYERVIGGGVAIPIPLPAPLGRTNKGEIAAERARVREAEQRVDAQTRALALQATVARHELVAREQAAAAYSARARASAQQSLADLSAEIEAGHLPVRDALIMQQSLLDLLLSAVESQHALCLASVDFVFAAGGSFDGGAR